MTKKLDCINTAASNIFGRRLLIHRFQVRYSPHDIATKILRSKANKKIHHKAKFAKFLIICRIFRIDTLR